MTEAQSISHDVRAAFKKAATLPEWLRPTLLTWFGLGAVAAAAGAPLGVALLPALVFTGAVAGHVLGSAARELRFEGEESPTGLASDTPAPLPSTMPAPGPAQYLANVLAARAELPTPTVYSIAAPGHGAYKVELDIYAHERTLTELPTLQIAGVLAHEIGHVIADLRYFDTLPGPLAQAWLFRHSIAQALVEGARAVRAVGLGVCAALAPVAAGPALAFTALGLAATPYLMHVAARAAQRRNEFSADRIGAELVGSPVPLAQALRMTEREDNKLLKELDTQTPRGWLRRENFSPTHWFYQLAHYTAPFAHTHPNTQARRRALAKLPRDPQKLAELKQIMA